MSDEGCDHHHHSGLMHREVQVTIRGHPTAHLLTHSPVTSGGVGRKEPVSHFRFSFDSTDSPEYNCELLWPLVMESGSHEELIAAPEAKPPPPSTDFVADDEEVRPQKYLISRAGEDACVVVLIY